VDDLLSEKEQIDQIRSWWSEYGGYVIVGVAAGALLLFGFNYYQNSKLAAQLEASALYETLTNHVVDGNLDNAESVADQLATAFAETTYAAQSKLAMARMYMDRNRDQDAADALDELLASAASEELKAVARLRLARILLYQDKPQDVVDLLEGRDNPAFAAAYTELLGDAYLALGRIADAQTAYQQVLMDPLSQGTVDQQLVQWKALDLPEVQTEKPPAEPATDDVVETSEPDASDSSDNGDEAVE